MSRQVRNRVTATALGGFLLGAALLTTGTANADQFEGRGRQVVFAGGGVLGVSCWSTPSVEVLSVPADGKVRLVNRTGHDARLRLDGESRGSIPDAASAEVVFPRGTTAVTLDPSCALTDQATPVLVTASPALTAEPDPIPAPIDSATDPTVRPTSPADPDPPDGPRDNGSMLPDSVAPPARPQSPSTTAAGRPTIRTSASRTTRASAHATAKAAQATPHRSSAPRVKTRKPVRGTAKVVAPTFSRRPPGADTRVASGVPALDQPSPSQVAPAIPAGPSAGIGAAEPVAAMRPLPESRPAGLLAMVAIVSVLGVTIAVIRAIVSERASRATVA